MLDRPLQIVAREFEAGIDAEGVLRGFDFLIPMAERALAGGDVVVSEGILGTELQGVVCRIDTALKIACLVVSEGEVDMGIGRRIGPGEFFGGGNAHGRVVCWWFRLTGGEEEST